MAETKHLAENEAMAKEAYYECCKELKAAQGNVKEAEKDWSNTRDLLIEHLTREAQKGKKGR